jgi:hypothetical protein
MTVESINFASIITQSFTSGDGSGTICICVLIVVMLGIMIYILTR